MKKKLGKPPQWLVESMIAVRQLYDPAVFRNLYAFTLGYLSNVLTEEQGEDLVELLKKHVQVEQDLDSEWFRELIQQGRRESRH